MVSTIGARGGGGAASSVFQEKRSFSGQSSAEAVRTGVQIAWSL